MLPTSVLIVIGILVFISAQSLSLVEGVHLETLATTAALPMAQPMIMWVLQNSYRVTVTEEKKNNEKRLHIHRLLSQLFEKWITLSTG